VASPTPPPAKTTQVGMVQQPGELDEALKVHREEALKRGRRHKRQLKKARFHVMVGSLGFIALVATAFFGYSLYLLQNQQSYSNLAYSAARIAPYNVSSVDGEKVSYEEYLFILKQNVHYLVEFNGVGAEKIDVHTEDGNKIIEQKKREALSQAESYAFIRKKAKELNITVDKSEVDASINELLALRGNSSREELATTLRAHYGWDISDYERFYGQVLLKKKVLSSLDENAKAQLKSAKDQLAAGASFEDVAKTVSDDESSKTSGGHIGKINFKLNNANLSYTILESLKTLQEGATSEPVITNDAYYIFKNLNTYSADEKEVAMIRVQFKPVDNYMVELETAGKIKRNIKLKESEIGKVDQ
jgi:parvulin-like peptidyl-prolyl isomerase